jgi:cytochrome c
MQTTYLFSIRSVLPAMLATISMSQSLDAFADAKAATSAATVTVATATIAGDAARGETLYQTCLACHAVDENDLGPKHRGVVGRTAGSVADYAYSRALKHAGFVWDESKLDRWLTNPSDMVPGTKMFFKLDDPQSRADVIAYLKELK